MRRQLRHGAEPPEPDPQFGRVSYTQYEALYARKRGKKVWELFHRRKRSPRSTPQDGEPEELRALQAAYRQKLQSDSHLFASPKRSHSGEASKPASSNYGAIWSSFAAA